MSYDQIIDKRLNSLIIYEPIKDYDKFSAYF